MKSKNFLFLFVILIFLGFVSSALEGDIELPDSFSSGDQILFKYSLSSDSDVSVNFAPYVVCENLPRANIESRNIFLNANQNYADFYLGPFVSDSLGSQECFAYLQFFSPENFIISEEFSLETLEDFNFNLDLDKSVFYLGEEIVIGYESDVADLEINAVLFYPDGSQEEISLPYSFSSEVPGSYFVEVTSSKEGYQDFFVKKNFGIVEESDSNKNFGDLRGEVTLKEKLFFVFAALVLIFVFWAVFRSLNR